MALYHNWDVTNGFVYVLQFFSLISDGLGGVNRHCVLKSRCRELKTWISDTWHAGEDKEKLISKQQGGEKGPGRLRKVVTILKIQA